MRKTLLIGAFAVAGLAGCASGPYPYNDSYGYGPTYSPYYYDYGYGGPADYGPNVGFGYYYYDSDGHRHWRDGDHRGDSGRHWEGRAPGNYDRGGRDFRGGETVGGDVRSSHGEMGNEAGAGRGGASSGGRGGSQQ